MWWWDMEQSSYANTITSSSGEVLSYHLQFICLQFCFCQDPLVDGDGIPWYVWLQQDWFVYNWRVAVRCFLLQSRPATVPMCWQTEIRLRWLEDTDIWQLTIPPISSSKQWSIYRLRSVVIVRPLDCCNYNPEISAARALPQWSRWSQWQVGRYFFI